jgi:opacity protein-like surface antigen
MPSLLAVLLAASMLPLAAGPALAAGAAALPQAPACPIFPATNVWNKPVDGLPVAGNSAELVRSIGLNSYLHPDFSSYEGGGYGIPYNVVGPKVSKKRVRFQWASESDRERYPIPRRPRIESGSDRHILMVHRTECRLYELFNARKTSSGWRAGSGAIWDLTSNALRPDGWTSADAAGLPILPGLVRYDEVAAGAIRHALRFTAPRTRRAYIYPARHFASDSNDSSLPPMGLRVRLKASVDISRFGPQTQVLLRALQVYGMILADNGSPWYITGAPDAGWDDDDLHDLHQLHGSDFEVVDTSSLRNG